MQHSNTNLLLTIAAVFEQAARVARRNSRAIKPEQLALMYEQLAAEGIATGPIAGQSNSTAATTATTATTNTLARMFVACLPLVLCAAMTD
jgi:hypothetical protein